MTEVKKMAKYDDAYWMGYHHWLAHLIIFTLIIALVTAVGTLALIYSHLK